jgi:Tfp pilus assembly PilM family ATPase
MKITLAHFQGGEISKHQNMVKKLREVVESLRERFRSIVADIPSVSGADFVLRD